MSYTHTAARSETLTNTPLNTNQYYIACPNLPRSMLSSTIVATESITLDKHYNQNCPGSQSVLDRPPIQTPFGAFSVLFAIPIPAVISLHFITRTSFLVLSNFFFTAGSSLYLFQPSLCTNCTPALFIKHTRPAFQRQSFVQAHLYRVLFSYRMTRRATIPDLCFVFSHQTLWH